jgi:hypothetical protein
MYDFSERKRRAHRFIFTFFISHKATPHTDCMLIFLPMCTRNMRVGVSILTHNFFEKKRKKSTICESQDWMKEQFNLQVGHFAEFSLPFYLLAMLHLITVATIQPIIMMAITATSINYNKIMAENWINFRAHIAKKKEEKRFVRRARTTMTNCWWISTIAMMIWFANLFFFFPSLRSLLNSFIHIL